MSRVPKNYDGPQVTTKRMSEVLPTILNQISERYQEHPDLILAAWPDVIGVQLAPMTQAVSFQEGILHIKVRNSTLYSLLNQYEKQKLLENLRLKFPKIKFQTIVFRIG